MMRPHVVIVFHIFDLRDYFRRKRIFVLRYIQFTGRVGDTGTDDCTGERVAAKNEVFAIKHGVC